MHLAALRDEIIPWVEARHPTAPERALIGYSLGGLFAMYAMFESPSTFTHYLLGSPSMYWNDEVMFQVEQACADKHKDLKARVFLSAGVDERPAEHVGNVMKFAAVLQDRNYPGLELATVSGSVHESANLDTQSVTPALLDGLYNTGSSPAG